MLDSDPIFAGVPMARELGINIAYPLAYWLGLVVLGSLFPRYLPDLFGVALIASMVTMYRPFRLSD